MQIEKIKKRTGHIVDFQPDKITTAILKAMRAVRGRVDEESISELTTYVLDAIDKLYGRRIPDVEGIQDQVERALMERGYFDVARAYILYRERQRSMRLEQRTRIEEKIKKHDLMVRREMDINRARRRATVGRDGGQNPGIHVGFTGALGLTTQPGQFADQRGNSLQRFVHERLPW